MLINITAGEELNRILTAKHPGQTFIPFNEAMIKGTFTALLFSDGFVRERAEVHGVSEASYRQNMKAFLAFLGSLGEYDDVVLWFGDEPFCQANLAAVRETLAQRGFAGKVTTKIVNEYTGEEI